MEEINADNESSEWEIARGWGVTEEAWADIQIERRLTAFFEDLLGIKMR
jgi:hypothetical protein